MIKISRLGLRCAAALLILPSLQSWAGTWNPFGPQTYVRQTGAPVTVTNTFSISNPNTQYTLHLQNGGLQDDTADYVSNTVITINGATVVAPGDFNQQTATLDKVVQLQAGTNTIAVQVRGKPGGELAATIIGVDNDLPSIQATVSPAPNAASWNHTAVTVTFQCGDATSGVASCSSPVTITTEGAGQVVTGKAVDLAGNVATTSVTLNIDLTPPAISPALVPAANSFGWNNTNVTVNFSCTDALSGIASCSPPVSFTSEGAGQTAQGTATDKAGNSATTTATVNIDKTPPTITASVSPAPDARGIVTLPAGGAATVTFTCSDPLSGVASCPSAIQVSTPGLNQQVSGAAVDKAGNSASATLTFSVEATPLAVTASASPTANAAGWNNSPVTISYQCTGGVPPVQCPASQTVSTQGANQVISATATDAAGQSSSASTTLNIDLTPPLITAAVSPTPNSNGIINAASATVSFTCSDSLSGILTCPSPVTVTTLGSQTISGAAVDIAGNTSSASIQFTLQPFPPLQIVAMVSPTPNAAGWNNSPVTVTFQCSGGAPPVSCASPQTVSSDGANQVVTGTATDSLGNSATTSVTINLDQTPPLVSITSPADGGISQSATVPVSGLTSDGLSGVASVSCNGTAATISNGSFSCSAQITQGSLAINVQATDVAGNTASASVTTNLQGPKLTVTSPAPQALFNSAAITVTGTVDDPNAAIVVNGVPATKNGGTFSASNVILREGNNVVTATGTNAGGAAGTASVTVVLDTTPPTVTISSPSDKAVVTTPQVYVTGLVNDIVSGTVNAAQVSVTVNGVQAGVNNRSFMAEGVLLVPGANVITAIATDRAGNVNQSSVTVTLQDASNKQKILMVSGNDQTGAIGTTLPQPLVVELISAIGQPMPNIPVTFTVNKSDGILSAYPQQGQQITVQTDVNGQASANLQLGTRVGTGNNSVLVTAPGFVGEIMFCESSTVGSPTQIHDISGGSQIGVINQPLPESLVAGVFDVAGNPIAGVPVTFKVEAGGGTLDGATNTSVTKTTDNDGRATTILTLAQEEGVNNNAVSATFPGLAGSPIIFTASGKTPGNPSNTKVTGIVLDNANQPIPNATASLQGTNLSALTDATGQFTIANAPIGSIVLFVDGSTSTRPESFPFLEFPMVTVAGQDNNLGRPIFLPTLDTNNSQVVGGDQDVTLTMNGVPGVVYTVFAHSATFPDGSKVGRLTLSQVHADKVPMLPPNGTAPTLVGTLQPSRVKFNPPIRVQLPNTDGLAPGQVTELFSFHHDLEQFVTEGTMRVSADGSIMVTDPGFGLTVSGWHGGGGPPPPPTCVNGCEPENDCNTAECVNGTCVQTPANEGDSCSDGASGQCGQGGVCTGGECVFDSTASDGTPCTPDDKCVQNAKCQGGVCKGTPINTEPKADVSLQAEAVLPDTLKEKLNSLLNSLPIEGSIQINEATVSFKGTEKDCCDPDTGPITNGEKEASASIKVAIELANVPIVGFSVSKRFSPFSFLDIRADLAIGLVFTTNVEIEGEGGVRHNDCEHKTCPFGSLSGSVKPELKATIEAIACFDTYTSEHCGGVTITPLGISASIQAGVSYNKTTCDDGVQGFLSIGQFTISIQFGIDVPKKFSIGVEIKPKILSGITCTFPGGCNPNGTGSD